MKYSIERAKEVLAENPFDFPDRDYLEALVNGRLPIYHKQRLTHLRKNFSDEIPTRNIRGDDQETGGGTKYKCQTHFGIAFVAEMRRIFDDGTIKNPLVFLSLKWKIVTNNFDFTFSDPKNHHKIVLINDILDSAINAIK